MASHWRPPFADWPPRGTWRRGYSVCSHPLQRPRWTRAAKKSFQAAELLLQSLQNASPSLVHSPFRDAHFRGLFGNLRPRNGGLQNIRQDREWKSGRSRSTIRRLALAEVEGSSR